MRRLARLAVVFALLSAAAVPARAVVIVALPSNELVEYFGTPTAFTVKGGPLYLVNGDTVPHSVVSRALRPDGEAPWCARFEEGYCPMFWSAEVVQSVIPVHGLEDVTEGVQYQFYCGVHPTMHGTLLIA